MIEIKNVSKSFNKIPLFENLNLVIQDGEYVVLSGKSGYGKTTILNMIGALEKIDSGEILVDGKNINKLNNKMKFFQNKVGFLFQNFALVDNKTVYQNLDVVYDKSRSGVTIEQALEQVGLSDKKNTKVFQLSGGEQQRVAIARLLIKKCDLILADEPTGSLDKENGDRIMNLLENLHKQGKTIVLVTHNEEYKTYGDRMIEIQSMRSGAKK